jgi:Na+-transporting methylmalonyl-CoA/oxaloacetate decarboxylase gamma subunit
MTSLAWIFLGTTVLWMVLALLALAAVYQMADEVTRQKVLFKEQEREHIKEIQELVNQYPPPKGDVIP